MPEGAIAESLAESTVTKSKLLNLPSGAGTVATPPKRSKGEDASLDPVMASNSMSQLDGDGVVQGMNVGLNPAGGVNVVNKMLPFMSNGKPTERSLGLADGVVKSMYHPLCWVVVGVLQDFG